MVLKQRAGVWVPGERPDWLGHGDLHAVPGSLDLTLEAAASALGHHSRLVLGRVWAAMGRG